MAWSKLIAASTAMDEDAAIEEFEKLFMGVGKAAVNLHASHHLTGFMMEQPLADVRSSLAQLGFVRIEMQTMVEDHIAALTEVMRLLIVGGQDVQPASLAEQRKFFTAHLEPWVELCCLAVSKSPLANFYAIVAQLTSSFLQVERDAFAIDA